VGLHQKWCYPSNLDVIQRSVLHWFVRPSGIWFQQSLLVSPATMTSADFLAHRKLVYSKISLGKMNILVPIPAISTISVLPSSRKAWTSACCATSSDLMASVYGFPQGGAGSVRQYRILQSRFLPTLHPGPSLKSSTGRFCNARSSHGKPACHLLRFGTLPPHLRDLSADKGRLSPVGTFI